MTKSRWTTGIAEKHYEDTIVAEYNQLESVRQVFEQNPGAIAAVILEPIVLNNNLIMPLEGFLEGLREIYDPELHYNIYDLGLVYDIRIEEDRSVKIVMTLTTPMCPIGPMITEQIQEFLGLMPGVTGVDVEFTFDPPWSPEKMTDEARADLGLD